MILRQLRSNLTSATDRLKNLKNRATRAENSRPIQQLRPLPILSPQLAPDSNNKSQLRSKQLIRMNSQVSQILMASMTVIQRMRILITAFMPSMCGSIGQEFVSSVTSVTPSSSSMAKSMWLRRSLEIFNIDQDYRRYHRHCAWLL